MLVLSRTEGQRIRIGKDVYVTVTLIKGNRVKLGIEAPLSTNVMRCEIEDKEPTPCGK